MMQDISLLYIGEQEFNRIINNNIKTALTKNIIQSNACIYTFTYYDLDFSNFEETENNKPHYNILLPVLKYIEKKGIIYDFICFAHNNIQKYKGINLGTKTNTSIGVNLDMIINDCKNPLFYIHF